MLQRCLLAFASVCLLPLCSQADIIEFDFRSSGAAGAALDNQTTDSYSQGGIAIAMSTSSNVGATTRFNAVSSHAGITSDIPMDDSSGIDSNETLQFIFTFDGSATVELIEIDWDGLGGVADASTLSVNGSLPMLFFNGAPDVGSDDKWTPSTPLGVNSGDRFEFGATNGVVIQSLLFGFNAIPEPTCGWLLSLTCAMLWGRRRSRL